MANKNPNQKYFLTQPMTFGDLEEKELRVIKDRLILSHRRHDGFALDKDGNMECDQCDMKFMKDEKGYLVEDGPRLYWIVGVNVTEEWGY